jgi:hypothetical protein
MIHASTNDRKTQTTTRSKTAEPWMGQENQAHSLSWFGQSRQSRQLQERNNLAALQKVYGNQAVLRMKGRSPVANPLPGGVLQRKCACGSSAGASGSCAECQSQREGLLQTKLQIGEPGDRYEQEAERVAEQVMRMPEPTILSDVESEKEGIFKRKAIANPIASLQRDSNAQDQFSEVPSIVHEVLQSPGQSLDPVTRAFMEPRFGQDFSQVHVHTDTKSAESAKALNSQAYTIGRDVVFGTGKYAPRTDKGKHLLAHELTHVVQQGYHSGLPESSVYTLMRFTEDKAFAAAPAVSTKPQPPFMGANFSIRADDPPCTQSPNDLGKVIPEVDCPTATEDIGLLGHHFHFCLGSDIFAVPQTPTEILRFVRKQPAQSQFNVHGYASTDGNAKDNMRLSCHRALRVAREMINAGVPPEKIEIARKGATDEFPGGPEFNRVAVVQVVPPPEGTPIGENLPVTTRLEKEAVVKRAQLRLREGTYGLGADAYIAFWTCGRIKRVSDAVDRMHVRFQGEPGLTKMPRPLGIAEGLGTNVIALSDAILTAANQDECVMERLMDMAFHQVTLDTIDTFDLRHAGARFLVGLAGLKSCEGAGINESIPTEDPLAFQAAPPCAETPLTTRLQPPIGKKQERPITFDADPVWEATSAKIRWELDVGRNRALIIVPTLPIIARAEVQARANASELAQYEIGFMQSVTRDRTIVNYVSGHRLELRVPTPIRDRDRRPSTAPWFASEFINQFDAGGNASTLMFKGIITEVPLAYEDVERGGVLQSGNVIDTTTRRIHFVTWLVARRRGAPIDRFATHFLVGREFDFTQEVDVLGIDGKGTFETDQMDADPDSRAVMQFGGPTPEDLGPNDLTITTNPPPRETAGKVTPFEFRGMIREIIEDLAPPRLGLKHSPLTVKVFIDANTGRVALPDPANKEFSPVVADSPNIPPRPLAELASEILKRARKRDFLGHPDKPAIVKRDPRDHTTSKFERVDIEFDPSPDILLIDRPGVKDAMREMWRRTERDENNGDPRGHALTIYIDRGGRLRPLIPSIQRGKPPIVIPQPDGSFIRIFVEECGGTSPDLENDTPLGTIHTHPNPATPPSGKDHETARDGTDICGIQFFIINNNFVMRYDATSDTIIGERKEILGL